MKTVVRAASTLTFLVVSLAAFAPAAHAQSPALAPAGESATPSLLQKMVGNWSVQQRMWPGAGAKAIELPAAVARRRMFGGSSLEEIIEPAPGSKVEPFSRVAYFNYNVVTQRFEYVSLDTRAPQLMFETSDVVGAASAMQHPGDLKLAGGTFVAPRWGDATNVTFKYRLTVGKVEQDRQVVQLYLTPRSGAGSREFLAFEYVYTRQR